MQIDRILLFLFQFKRAPYLDYIDVAALYGINNLIEKDVSNSFKKAFKAVNDEFPNFGGNSSISSQDWWCKVVLETFKGNKDSRHIMNTYQKLTYHKLGDIKYYFLSIIRILSPIKR